LAEAPLPRWAAIALLAFIATVFGSNHVAARVAFDHGASVATAVAFRSSGTALFVLSLLLAYRIPLALPAATRYRAVAIGVLLAVQSYCLYSAVAAIPVALALLAFQTFPMLLALIAWAVEGERPSRRVMIAMPAALAGLALALDVWGGAEGFAGRWREIGAGVLWASGAALAFAGVMYLTTRWLAQVDGRLRSFLVMTTIAVVVLAGGAAAGAFRAPGDATGWAAIALLTVLYGSAITALFVILPRIGAMSNTVALNFEPIAVLGIAWVTLGQSVTPLQILGAFVVVGAIVAIGLR
jgi:drug/metabolite transporter (DMT)-like permease